MNAVRGSTARVGAVSSRQWASQQLLGITMKIFAWLVIFFAPVACAADLVGTKIPPYPDGLSKYLGACIAASALVPKNACEYSIGVLEDANKDLKVLYGARLIGSDDAGKSSWMVTDAMSYPVLPKGYILSVATCNDNGKNDEAIIAAVKMTDKEWHENVLWARRYDINSGKFVDHPTKSIRCLNEDWGL